MREYSIMTIEKQKVEALVAELNNLARQGWKVVCPCGDKSIILEKEFIPQQIQQVPQPVQEAPVTQPIYAPVS